jgi:hypothetical protein
VNFGFTPPDPDQVLESLDRLKDAFQRAASAETGNAKPLFVNLSNSFNKTINDVMDMAAKTTNPDPNKIMMQMMPAMMQLQNSVNQLRREAATNPAAAQTLQQLESDIREEVSNLMGGSIPGMPSIKRTPPKPPAPKGPKPKRPGDGSFDL